MKCEQCRFWIRQTSMMLNQKPQGECRRYPPKIHIHNQTQGIAAMLVPTSTPPEFWCGEFKADEAKIS